MPYPFFAAHKGRWTLGPLLIYGRKGYDHAHAHHPYIGFLLLAIWLTLYGLIGLFSLSFAGLSVIMAILAIAAGVFILLERWVYCPDLGADHPTG